MHTRAQEYKTSDERALLAQKGVGEEREYRDYKYKRERETRRGIYTARLVRAHVIYDVILYK